MSLYLRTTHCCHFSHKTFVCIGKVSLAHCIILAGFYTPVVVADTAGSYHNAPVVLLRNKKGLISPAQEETKQEAELWLTMWPQLCLFPENVLFPRNDVYVVVVFL